MKEERVPQNARAGLLDDLTIHARQPVDSKAGFLLAAHLWLPDITCPRRNKS